MHCLVTQANTHIKALFILIWCAFCFGISFSSSAATIDADAGIDTAIADPLAPQEQAHIDPELRSALSTAVNDASTFDDRYAAEVWLLDMSSRLQKRLKTTEKWSGLALWKDPQQRIRFLRAVHEEASRAELPPELVLALIEVESNFDPWAFSYAGARGIMQIMPFWLNEIGRPDDNLFDVQTNLRFGCTILKFYIDKEKGDKVKGLARYNGSTGKTWYSERVFKALRERWYRS
ncbi:lytic transglycosylase domain-containing protein [Beggiatoa alba]|nr:lytic transglycosylase domain-containing protein [Beggiatoa alba]